MYLGKFRHKINVASEFKELSKADTSVAELLAENKEYRHACYFIIQAMEKAIRAKIFNLVNPNIEYFRERNRTHSLESAVEFLIEIVNSDKLVQEQVSKQLNEHVLGKTKYNHLHNNLRYPSYFKKYDSYSIFEVGECDYKELKLRLDSLNNFLNDLHKFT